MEPSGSRATTSATRRSDETVDASSMTPATSQIEANRSGRPHHAPRSAGVAIVTTPRIRSSSEATLRQSAPPRPNPAKEGIDEGTMNASITDRRSSSHPRAEKIPPVSPTPRNEGTTAVQPTSPAMRSASSGSRRLARTPPPRFSGRPWVRTMSRPVALADDGVATFTSMGRSGPSIHVASSATAQRAGRLRCRAGWRGSRGGRPGRRGRAPRTWPA